MGNRSPIEELVERAPLAASIKDGSGRYVCVNDAWLALLSLTRDEVIGRTDVEFFASDVAEDFVRGDARVLATGEAVEVESVARVQGMSRALLWTKFPLGSDDERRVGGIALDVSARSEAQAAVARSEARFRSLVEHSPEAYLVFDPAAGRFVDANETAARFFRLSLPDLRGKGIADLSPVTQPNRESSARAAERHIQAALTGEFPVFDWVHLARDGELLPSRVWLARVDIGGRFGVRASILDMREVDRAQGALRQARAELDAIQNALPQLVAIVDANTTELLHINRAYAKVFGADCANVDWLSESGILARVGDEEQLEEDVAVHGRDGTHRLLDVRLSVFARTDHGSPQRLLLVAEDVTARRAAEAALRQTCRLESLGRLAGGIAHDFNNLLAVILYSAEFLEETLGHEDAAREDLAVLVGAAQQARALTAQLLAFSRPQSGAAAAIDADKILSDLAPMLKRLLGEDIRVRLNLGATGIKLWLAAGQLEQIIINLAVNARDAMATGDVLSIATAVVAQGSSNQEFLEIAVSDSGCGMPEGIRERVFEPFFTTKAAGQGTGLGLSTVNAIVQRANGKVLVESAVGVGTTVRVRFPVYQGTSAAHRPSCRSELAVQGQRLLLVEDDPGVRRMAECALTRAGFVVHVASGPAHAMELAPGLASEVDAIVSDIVMPELSGPELFGKLERILGDVPVLYISGYSADALNERGVIRDDIDVIEKPFSGKDLVARVLTLLGN